MHSTVHDCMLASAGAGVIPADLPAAGTRSELHISGHPPHQGVQSSDDAAGDNRSAKVPAKNTPASDMALACAPCISALDQCLTMLRPYLKVTGLKPGTKYYYRCGGPGVVLTLLPMQFSRCQVFYVMSEARRTTAHLLSRPIWTSIYLNITGLVMARPSAQSSASRRCLRLALL